MSRRRYDRNWRCHKPGYVWLAGPLLDQILDWLCNITLPNGGRVTYNPGGIAIAIPPGGGVASTAPAILKIVGGKDHSGFYEADLYGNGAAAAATQASVSLALRGWDIDITDAQGFYLATAVPGVTNTYEAVGQVPLPPATGIYYLRVSGGVVRWTEAGNCQTSGGSA